MYGWWKCQRALLIVASFSLKFGSFSVFFLSQDSLSKTKFETNAPMESARFLSHYLIVVTTFERCAMEYKLDIFMCC